MSEARLALLVALIAALCAAPSLRNGFVYDDVPAVEQDTRLGDPGLHLLAVPYWRDTMRDRLYRPVTTVSFALDRAAGGGSTVPFHLTNILLNALVSALVFLLAHRLLQHAAAAFVAAAWFALHPVHVEAVANVVGRSELLAAAGYLVAVLAWLAGPRLALLVLAGAAIAFGAKEHALTLPAALLLCAAWRAWIARQPFAAVFRAQALTWVAVLVMAAGFLAARAAVAGSAFGGGSVGAGLEGLDLPGRFLVMTPALLVWARLLIIPLRLSADYSPAHFEPAATWGTAHILAIGLAIACVIAAWKLRRSAPVLVFALAWLAVTASVAFNVVVPTGVMLAERTLYLPSAGAALAVGVVWTMLPRGRALWPATAVVLALLAARAVERAGVWRNQDRFYEALVRDAPRSYRALWAQGDRAFRSGRAAEGERLYRRAVETWPDPAVMQELGERYAAAGALAPAERWFMLAWQADTLRFDAALQAVVLRQRLGRADSAAVLGERALARFPEAATLLVATSDAWFTLGRPARALSLRRRAVFAAPHTWQYQHIAAEGALRAGRCDEARWRARDAARRAPAEAAARELLDRLERLSCSSA